MSLADYAAALIIIIVLVAVYGSSYYRQTTFVYSSEPKAGDTTERFADVGPISFDTDGKIIVAGTGAVDVPQQAQPSYIDENIEQDMLPAENEYMMSCQEATEMYLNDYPEASDFKGGAWLHFLANFKIPGNDYEWKGESCV